MSSLFRVYRDCFDPEAITVFPRGKRAPVWLGNFAMATYGTAYGRAQRHMTDEMVRLHEHLVRVAGLESQEFTTWFLQTYRPGEQVHRHRDPKNNKGWCYVAVFGDFAGAESSVWDGEEEHRFSLGKGDMVAQACTVAGVQGPAHAVSPVTTGLRHVFIADLIR